MNVVGYVVRFCESPNCAHTSAGNCPNVKSSKFYVEPSAGFDIVDKPLVVAHDPRHVVGRCVSATHMSGGILIECVLDDYYLIECLRRRFHDFADKYNPDIGTFENFCKKTLCSFSLSHNPRTNRVYHVSLVDTPGRKGTVVRYKHIDGGLLKRRAENEFVSDIVASHSTAYASQTGRRNYLLDNDKLSHLPGDLCYINAAKDLDMPKRTSSTMELFKEFIQFRDLMDCHPQQKVQRLNDGGGEQIDANLDYTAPAESSHSNPPPPPPPPPPPSTLQKNDIGNMILSELKLLRESVSKQSHESEQQQQQQQQVSVEAAAPRVPGGNVIIAQPSTDVLDAFVRSITGGGGGGSAQ
ncbi:hypothetical protein ElyMa_003966700 [Elysia marginata]|uniref:Uncharacterized protein n=1 Tax=Elysia marginata TaxID=1093978 RepID=A0AAV4FVB5_9GAST|nr:hypothetical protein ElyMa_003966700 [Elysia marginata]